MLVVVWTRRTLLKRLDVPEPRQDRPRGSGRQAGRGASYAGANNATARPTSGPWSSGRFGVLRAEGGVELMSCFLLLKLRAISPFDC